jgi:hypothetical protein
MSSLPKITDPPRRRPGRQPGCDKIPGSGRKAGGKNLVSADLRAMILDRGRPIELLCDIARGLKIRTGPQAGPNAQHVYPNLQERAAAAKILVDKLLANATPPTPGDDGNGAGTSAGEMDPGEAIRRIAFALAKGAKESGDPAPAPAVVCRREQIEAAQAERSNIYPLTPDKTPEQVAAESEEARQAPWRHPGNTGPERQGPTVITRRPLP